MKITRTLPLLVLLLVGTPCLQSCSEAIAAEATQGSSKRHKIDTIYTGKITSWGVTVNGSIYIEVTGTNTRNETGSIWVKAEAAKTVNTGLAYSVLQVVLHYKGSITVEGKKRGSMNGSSASHAMDLQRIGKFDPKL